jgi:diguanylate cyclase (GGDEF)-like protein
MAQGRETVVDITEVSDLRSRADDDPHYIRLLEAEVELLTNKNQKLIQLINTQDKQAREIETRLSTHPKTGLSNHNRMNSELQSIFDNEADLSTIDQFALIIIRLDNKFDMVTKTLKSTVSEWVLYQIAGRINEIIRPEDQVFHTRDDEFVVLFMDYADADELKTMLSALNSAVVKPHLFSGYHIVIGCHIGVSIYPDHGLNRSTLLHNADIALEAAIQHQKPCKIFKDEMREVVIEKMELQNNILKALEAQALAEMDRQFELFFQPLVRINGIAEDSLFIERIDAEVLIRWHHPEKGLVMPDKFIPVAEETGLILPMGNWILYRAVQYLEEWDSGPLKDVVLSINISPKQFRNDQLIQNVIRIMKNRPKAKNRLKLEITESCVMDDPISSIEKMDALREYGVKFSVDDFGSGYSSLNYLRKLPVSSIKIDKSFINNLEANRQDRAIVRAIIAMGNELQFDTVCEGVERYTQLKFLVDEGCKIIQGYYFSKPQNEAGFRSFVSDHAAGALGIDLISRRVGTL